MLLRGVALVLILTCTLALQVTKNVKFVTGQQWNAVLVEEFGYDIGGRLQVSITAPEVTLAIILLNMIRN
jgi:hypothetical protein